MDHREDHMKMNFEYFQIQKKSFTNSLSGELDEKNGVICLVGVFPSFVKVLKLSKKCIFCNFVLTTIRTLSLIEQFTYMHLKGVVTQCQEMVLFLVL